MKRFAWLALPLALGALAACESEVPRPKPGQTCFKLANAATGTSGDDFCEPWACVPDEHELSVDGTDGAGLVCSQAYGCAAPSAEQLASTDPWERSRVFEYKSGDYTLRVWFDGKLFVDGYTLENLEKYVLKASLTFPYDPAYLPALAESDYFHIDGDPLPHYMVHFTSYENGVVHLEVDASLYRVVEPTFSTPPYTCGNGSGGWGYTTCTTKSCSYSSEADPAIGGGSGAPVDVKFDFTGPIAVVH